MQQNFTYFFDINSDGVYAKWLRSIVPIVAEDKKDSDGIDLNPWTRKDGLADSKSPRTASLHGYAQLNRRLNLGVS